MRTLKRRSRLPLRVQIKLKSETTTIISSPDKRTTAALHFRNARKAAWFLPVVNTLKRLSGKGQRCMYCSGSEASDVEHFRPVATFPQFAMTWANFLWSCTPCNRVKLDRFPPDTEPGGEFINPLDENPWNFFFIDKFGFLSPKFVCEKNELDPRAVTTRNLLDLNREALQEARHFRIRNLSQQINDSLSLYKKGKLSKKQLQHRLTKWKNEPFQIDVADYFLNGPGKTEIPFCNLFKVIEN